MPGRPELSVEAPFIPIAGDRVPRSCAYSIAFTLLTKYSVSPKQLVGTPMCCS